jgi:hypothetical protein
LVESAPLLLTFPETTFESSPEPRTLEEEEIQPLDFPLDIEEDLFQNFRNTSTYRHQKRPPVSVSPFDPLDKASLKETIKGLTTIISSEWLQEGELSSKAIQIHTPSLTIQCFIQGTAVTALYNPTVGTIIISASFALNHLGKNSFFPTTKTFQISPRSIIEALGIVHDVPVWHEDVEITLDFHVFEVQDFNVLIRYLVEKLFLKVSPLDVTLGGRTYSMPIS